MSQRHAVQDATGVIATNDGGDIIIACGTSTPGDGAAGYSNGCIYIKTDQGDHQGVFANIGSNTSANFNLVTVATG